MALDQTNYKMTENNYAINNVNVYFLFVTLSHTDTHTTLNLIKHENSLECNLDLNENFISELCA